MKYQDRDCWSTQSYEEEKGYRRGFQQGLAYAYRYISSGISVEELDDHASNEVAFWRIEDHKGKMIPHPIIDKYYEEITNVDKKKQETNI